MKEESKGASGSEKENAGAAGSTGSAKRSSALHKASPSNGKKIQDDDKDWADDNLEVGIVEIASNLSDLSGSTGESNNDMRHYSTKNADAKEFEILIQAKHAQACKAMGNGHYKASLEIFESILSDMLARFGGKHKRVGAALHNVAIANLRAGNLDDAMDAIEEAIKIRSKALGRKHSKVTDSLVEYGIILLAMEEYADALKVFEGALSMRKNERNSREDGNERRLRIAKIYNNIGCVHFDKGDLRRAKESFDEAITIFGQVYGIWSKIFCGKVSVTDTGYLAMASTLCNKAYVEMKRENFKDAITYLKQSLEIQKELLGTENKLVKSSLDNLGYSLLKSGDHEKALKVYLEIWADQEDSIRASTEEKVLTLRKLVYCELLGLHYEQALEHLGVIEDLLVDNPEDEEEAQLYDVQKLMGEVNYQIFKHPSFADTANRTFGCTLCPVLEDEDVSLNAWHPPKPEFTSKMSGHRIAHA